MAKITVYYFESYNAKDDEVIISKRMAPIAWIEKHSFTPLKETAKEIDASILDRDGLYREKK